MFGRLRITLVGSKKTEEITTGRYLCAEGMSVISTKSC